MRMHSLLAAGILLGAGVSYAQMERTFERTLAVSGPVTLDLTTDAGGIVVTRGASGSVRVRGILKAEHNWFGSANVEARMRQLESNPPIHLDGNTVRVGHVTDSSLLRGISMRLEIAAPFESRVRARADSGGIRVDGVKGPLDCQTDSGGVDAGHIEADVRASTDSGGVHLRDIKGTVYARTDSGGIEAFDIGGSIDAQTDSGGIRISQTVAAPVRARADSGGAQVRLASGGGYDVKAHSESGQVTVPELTVRGTFSRHEVQGTLRGGGPLVDVSVDSGDVEIRI